MSLSPSAASKLVADQMFPALMMERTRLDNIDNWYRWNHDQPHNPRNSTREYQELSSRAQTPWLGLVVTTVAQALYVEGYRPANQIDNSGPWDVWQANGMDARQIPVHRAALAYGYSYLTVLPGELPNGDETAVMRGVSPRRMMAFYHDPAEDEWPAFAMRTEPARLDSGQIGYQIRLYDDTEVHYLLADGTGSGVEYIESRTHGAGVCPVVRFANLIDLEGRADGEVEPFIPLASRIDQTVFDRLVVQRFSSWVVRTIAGMTKPDDADDEEAQRLRLRVEDLLVAEDPDTKFGSLPATPLDGFINAAEADIKVLAAVSQTPAHEMLGQMANLSAEALAAAEASLTRKVEERKHTLGESWEQAFRLAAAVLGDEEAAVDTSAQVVWRDTESRSLAQAADALGKLAQMLQVPVQVLWEKIPGWTQQDVDRAKAIAEQGGALEALMRELAGGQVSSNGQEPVGIV